MSDSLAVWLTAVDAAATLPAFLSWGTAAPSSGADKFFRVKNTSVGLTASGVYVGVSDPGGGTEDISVYIYFSTDGLNWSASVSLPDLPPQAVSAPVTMRRVVPSTAQTSALQHFSLDLSVSSWGSPMVPRYPLAVGP